MIQIQLGKTNILPIVKQTDFGWYLDGGPVLGNILLPNNEITEECQQLLTDSKRAEGTAPAELPVFLYLDQEERIVATTRQPLAQVDDFAYLEVAWVNNYGAFLHWGLMKDLFVPFREQKMKMQKGQRYIVHIHLDEESYRIMASAKVERYLSHEMPPYRRGDEVEVLIWQKTDLGFKAIVDNSYGALIYDDQVFRGLHTGDRTRAYVSQVRPDGKLDLMLQRPGVGAIADFSDILLEHLRTNAGHTVLCDKSPAEEIYSVFGVSKKVFKKAVGDLYKRRLITIQPDGITLTEQTGDNSAGK